MGPVGSVGSASADGSVSLVGSTSSIGSVRSVGSFGSFGSARLSQLSAATLRWPSQTAAAWTVRYVVQSFRPLYTALCRHLSCRKCLQCDVLKFGVSFGWGVSFDSLKMPKVR